jgi:hypothetical protein
MLDLCGGITMPEISWEQGTEPLTLLPAQARHQPELLPYQRLLAAVLTDTLLALQPPMPGRANLAQLTRWKAVRWFRFPDLGVMVNLRDCCEALGLNVRRVQRSVLPVFRRESGC